VAAATLTLLAAAVPAQAAGSLAGPTALPVPAGFTWSQGFAVNDAGTVVGAGGPYEGPGDEAVSPPHCGHRALRWTAGTVTVLETPADAWSTAFAQNNLGTTVGVVTTTQPRRPDGYCPDILRRAAKWDSAGHLTLLAPHYTGDTMATGVNDVGEIVGLAFPPGTSMFGDGLAVGFVKGDAVPLSATPLPVTPLGLFSWDAAPGPHLTNRSRGNVVVGASFVTGAFSIVVDGDSPGTVQPLETPGGTSVNHVNGISADGTVLVGQASGLGLVWDRTGPSQQYVAHNAPQLPGDFQPMQPYGVSPDGTILVGEGLDGPSRTNVGVVYSRTTGAAGWTHVAYNPGAVAVSNNRLVVGLAATGAATWQFTP
jgi:uncharacterized membrane protein